MQTNNETSQIPIKIENQTTTLNNGNDNITNLEIKNVINNNIQQTNNIQSENTIAASKDNCAKSSKCDKCEEKCPFCFCKVKLLFCFNPCNKEDREKYKNEIPRTCCCILVVLLWIYLIYCMIIIFLCFYLPCVIMQACGEVKKEKKKKQKKICDFSLTKYFKEKREADILGYAYKDAKYNKEKVKIEDTQ